MSQRVGFVALSHSPSWNLSPSIDGPGALFVDGVTHASRWMKQQSPDVFVVFGPDHFRNFFYDVLPQFCIGVERVEAFGDYGTPSGPLPCAAELGRHILERVMQSGFDPAVSLNMSVDHGLTQPYAAIDPSLQIPIVPIMMNVNGGPRPSFQRCVEFGRAVGEAVRSFPGNRRVGFIGSGGLSHWLPKVSADDPETTEETRDYVINGRPRAREYNAAREQSSIARRQSGATGPVGEAWDHWFIEQMKTGDFSNFYGLSDDEIERDAGNGAHELRTWVTAASAWGGTVDWSVYEPVPTWVTGMGVIAGMETGHAVG